jgi:hypothetical protein
MGWWEQLTGSEQRYKARRDADRAAASAATAQTDAIAQGRDIMQKYYIGGGDGAGNWVNGAMTEVNTGAQRAENLINQGSDKTTAFLGDQYQTANNQITGARDQGLAIAQKYYQPFQDAATQSLQAGTALNKLTGLSQADPGEIEALTSGSPLYKWREEQAQQAMARKQRAAGISDSRFSVGESGRLNAQLTAEEQDRRINQLMDIYRQGTGMANTSLQAGGDQAGMVTGAGSKMADLTTQGANAQANIQTGRYQNLANLETDSSTKRAGLYQDLGDSIAASYGAQGAARASSFATAAQNAMAGYNQPSPLQQAVSIYSAAKGGKAWW